MYVLLSKAIVRVTQISNASNDRSFYRKYMESTQTRNSKNLSLKVCRVLRLTPVIRSWGLHGQSPWMLGQAEATQPTGRFRVPGPNCNQMSYNNLKSLKGVI